MGAYDDDEPVQPREFIEAHARAGNQWRDRFVSREEGVDPEQLLANPLNPRIHPSKQQRAMYEVLAKLGWVGEVKVNINTGRVIDGHMRIALAITHHQRVPVHYYDLTEQEEAMALAVYDAISRQAIYDADLYAEVAAEWDDPSDNIAKLFDEMLPKKPLNDDPSPAADGEDSVADMSDVTYGMVDWSETKVRCTGDEIGDLTKLHLQYRADNNGKDDGFIAWLTQPHLD